jgi:energy-coupling factor transporter ATP-binding protein EcfA2
MNRYVIIDGPEKSGKSTTIEALRGLLPKDRTFVRHWGPIKPDDRAYAEVLKAEMRPEFYGNNNVIIWDRSWASEYVYNRLLNRPRRGAANPWLLEWLHGRALYGHSVRTIIYPQNVSESAIRRDDTDLPVDPFQETMMFYNYAQEYFWNTQANDFRPETIDKIAEAIKVQLDQLYLNQSPCSPMYYTMPLYRSSGRWLVMMGDKRNVSDYKKHAGAWLPFSSLKMTQFAQKYFGNRALNFAWTNAADIEKGDVPISLVNGNKVVTFGSAAAELCRRLNITPAGEFDNLSVMSRWNTNRGREQLIKFERELAEVV